MPVQHDFAIEEDVAGQRLDQFLADSLAEVSRSQVQKLIREGAVQVNGLTPKASYRLEQDDVVTVSLPDTAPMEILAEAIPLDVIYEDDDLAVINKPAGMVVHPAEGNPSGTLVNAALARWPQIAGVGEEGRAGIVHRLDKDTSGVILLAKTPEALEALQAQFRERTVSKTYIALVEGVPSSSTGIIDAAIGRDPKQRKKKHITRDGRESQTRYTLIEDFDTNALLEVEPYTGRTHQIRIHLAWLGHPVVGDTVYGFRKQRIRMKRLFLHAARLEVTSPSAGERLRFEAPLPASLLDILDKLRRHMV